MTGLRKSRPGISLVKLVVAVALLSVVSLAAIQLLNMTERTMIGSQTKLNDQLRSESIASYIYKDFARGELDDAIVSRTYTNDSMPDDLRGGGGVTVVSLYGKANRFNGVDPRCPLHEPANPSTGTFQMQADCMTRGGQTIIGQMNDLIAKGVVLTTGLQGGIGRCSISQTITVDPVTNIATVKVDDPNCLRSGTDQTVGVPKGNHVLLPRFVAYDSNDPRIFHTSMIEPPDAESPGIGLEMPLKKILQGGGVRNAAAFVDAMANNPAMNAVLQLRTEKSLSSLNIGVVPDWLAIEGRGSARLKLTGTLEKIRQGLMTLEYRSPRGFIGRDFMYGELQSKSLLRQAQTELDVRMSCGDQQVGTLLRFDLGRFDPVTGSFNVVEYITSLSYPGTELPAQFYGYCGPPPSKNGTLIKFDRPDGSWTTYTGGFDAACANASRHFNWNDGQFSVKPGIVTDFPYVKNSPKYRTYQKPDHVTVFLYEYVADTDPPANAGIKSAGARTNNRFSLFFQFDTFDQSFGKVQFELNNIEANRNLADLTDPFTFLDDTHEFTPNTIGTDGRMRTRAGWKYPNDGAVIPLRLPDSAFDNSTGFFELNRYVQNADGDANSNPNLRLISWEGLRGWNIRMMDIESNTVRWKTVPFDNTLASQKTDIQIRIEEAQRCPPSPSEG